MTAVPPVGLVLTVSVADETTLALAGELDMATGPHFAAVLDAVIDRGQQHVTIDCNELEFIDATGVGVLVAAQHRLRRTRGEIHLHGASPMTYRIFEITNLVDSLHVQRRVPNERPDAVDADRNASIEWQVARLAAATTHADAIADKLTRLSELIPEIVSACDRASVTVRRPNYFLTAAASDDTARVLDELQYADHEGPCVEAATDGVQTHASALAHEQRWQTFTSQARGYGIESILSSPLIIDDQPIGALNLYSRTPHAFSPLQQEIASGLAEHIAMLMQTPEPMTGSEFDDRIHDALDSRDTISRAQGILMERFAIDAHEAFATLRHDSVSTSVPLRIRAGEIAAETQLPAAASSDSGVPADE